MQDGSANQGRAGEGDLVDVHMGGNGSTSRLAEAGDDVDDTSWDTGLLAKSGGKQTRQRCLLGGLQDDRITGGQSRPDLPCPHEQREVPRDDLTADTHCLVSRVVEGLWVRVDGLAMDLVCPSAIVSQAPRGQLNVNLCHRERLAIVQRLDGGKGIRVFVEEVAEFRQHLTPDGGKSLSPDAIEGFASGLDGNVDI